MHKSKGWQSRSARPFGRIRAYVLIRDREQCQLRMPGCLQRAPLRAGGGVPAGQAHHTRPRAVVGDDPRYMVAACQLCNVRAGDPTTTDPPHQGRTDWSAPS